MTETDRANALHELDARHDALLAELEALDREVQQALATIRPPASPAALHGIPRAAEESSRTLRQTSG